MSDRGKLLLGWVNTIRQGEDRELWGQVIEAAELYSRAGQEIRGANSRRSELFSQDEMGLLVHIGGALFKLAKELRDLSFDEHETSSHMASQMREALQSLVESSHKALETEVPSPSSLVPHKSSSVSEPTVVTTGIVISQPVPVHLSIIINKIGLKDPSRFVDPFFTVSIRNINGHSVEMHQDIRNCKQRDQSYLIFNKSVVFRTPIDQLPTGCAIFFELKHYKVAKKTVSTRCFSFIEQDEMSPGQRALEIYKKPTDFKRQKLFLVSVKPLYLHISLSLTHTLIHPN